MSPANRTVMAFDYGLRQIGVAVGNRELRTAQPFTVLKAKDGVPNWDAVSQSINEWQPATLVVGEPLNMDGSDSEMSARARKFARQLEGRYGLPVMLMDERLSSREAKEMARERGHDGDYHKSPIDADAAALILQSWLNEN